MEGLPINSDDYLKRVEKTDFGISDEEFEGSKSRLSKPFENITTTENGFDVDKEDIKISVKYKPYKYKIDPNEAEEQLYSMNTAKVIENLTITFGEKTMNLLDILPASTQIIIWPGSDKETGNTLHADENGIKHISILGEIDNPKMFAVLLHEIGHLLDDKKMEELGLSNFMKERSKNSDLAEEIRRERAASAFALHVMRPFLKDKTERRDMLNFIKTYLMTYYDSAVIKIEDRKHDRRPRHFDHNVDDFDDYSKYE